MTDSPSLVGLRTIPDRVSAGVAWLDTHVPSWVDRVDLDELEMKSCYRCVLGQLFGDYWASPLKARDFCGDKNKEVVAFGFQARSVGGRADAEYDALAAEWCRVVSERRAAVAS